VLGALTNVEARGHAQKPALDTVLRASAFGSVPTKMPHIAAQRLSARITVTALPLAVDYREAALRMRFDAWCTKRYFLDWRRVSAS